jgi:hypothetical protein
MAFTPLQRRQLRARRMSEGKCQDCERPVYRWKVCRYHYKKCKAKIPNRRKWRKIRAESIYCVDCGKIKETRKNKCNNCLRLASASQKRTIKKYEQNGRCVRCGRKLDEVARAYRIKNCSECSCRENERRRLYAN